jgi:shikimate dehydrogenase
MDMLLIENQLNIINLDKYAAIIGESPSKGARSPQLWNKAFESSGLNYSMVPLDVTKDRIIDLLNDLNSDGNFIGGAIAVPYKEVVAKWLKNNITSDARKIGAVNCLYRGADGQLMGTNTDGEASLVTFEKNFGSLKNKSVVLFGVGGAGKAVASYFSSKAKSLTLASRSNRDQSYADKIAARWTDWSEVDNFIKDVDVIVNCTSVGFGDQVNKSPLSKEQIIKLKESTIIFDIIYQPIETMLLTISKSRNLRTLNGLEMNLEQAVLAYKYAVKTDKSLDEIRNIMQT